MKLEIGNFNVKDIQFGPQTTFVDGILTVNKEEAISLLNPEKKLKNIDLKIVRPGENVRLLPVKDIVEPRFRPDGRSIFPGSIGLSEPCGDGMVYAMKGMAILTVGKYGGWMDGMVDMSGPASELTYVSKLKHLVIVAEDAHPFDSEFEKRVNDSAFRLATHLLAAYVGKTLKGQTPESVETYELEETAADLPKVAYVLHLMTNQGRDGYNHLLYGRDMMLMNPTLVHPNEILDGALVGDLLSCGSAKLITYDMQNNPVIKNLYQEHGKTIQFVGVILATQEANVDDKNMDANRVVQIAKLCKLDGAIVNIKGSGNVNVDFFNSICKLEDAGIKTVGLAPVNPGRDGMSQPMSVMDPKGDALVIGGSSTQIIELPAMETVIGDLESLVRDHYPGAWAIDPEHGPSLREDGAIIVDTHIIFEQDGCAGWSDKTVVEF